MAFLKHLISRGWAVWIVAVLLTIGTSTHGFIHDDNEGIVHHWALLIAGSRGNYRHQADVAHAYHVLVDGGMPPERIIVMMEDDIAYNPYNPTPGKVYNCPGCDDVYHDVKIDYRSVDVNATNFLSVLAGDSEAMHGIGSGRVVASGAHDRVFVYYTDHGTSGMVGMPHGGYLFADDLTDTLRAKHQAGGFYELVFFMEACESGSMFRGMLNNTMRVFTTTASNATESSWATYCPTHVVPRNETAKHPTDHINTCLGDLYSVGWIELAEKYNLHHWSLQKEFERVRNRTSNHHTFKAGSHVQEFGRMEIAQEHASNFEGYHKRAVPPQPHATLRSPSDYTNLEQHEADLLHLRLAASGASSTLPVKNALLSAMDEQGQGLNQVGAAERSSARMNSFASGEKQRDEGDVELVALLHAQWELQSAIAERAEVDEIMNVALELMLWDATVSELLGMQPRTGNYEFRSTESALARIEAVAKQHDAVRNAAQQPIVDSWSCLKTFVGVYEKSCGPMSTYAARHTLCDPLLCHGNTCENSLMKLSSKMIKLLHNIEFFLPNDRIFQGILLVYVDRFEAMLYECK